MASGLAIGYLIVATAKEPEKGTTFKITAIVILSILTLVLPVLFSVTLWRNRKDLAKEPVQKKIGALYEHHNPDKALVGSYPIVFLVRRSLFVGLTFALYNFPGIQI